MAATGDATTGKDGVAGGSPPPGLVPIASISRRDGVITGIRRAIVLGTLKPGEKLTENRLSAALKVSRPTMREALAQLAQEGLLVQEPYRGLRVADLDAGAIMDIARTRVSLDMLAVEGIFDDPSGRRLARVQAAWEEYERLPLDADPIEAHESHIAFHRAIWEASENTLLIRLWPMIEAHVTIVLAQDQATRDDPRRAHDVHKLLVDAILSRDLERVHRAQIVHTVDSAKELIEILRAGKPAHAG
jgi:DNA-binding GntR family transcriptional regulator